MTIDLSPEATYTFLLILIRTASMLVASPLLSHRGIPAQAKIGFAVFTALVLTPITPLPSGRAPETLGRLVDDVLREALFGLGLGLSMNIVLIGLQMASRIIGLQVGFGLGAVFDPITGTEFGVFDQFYSLLVTLVFFAIDGHHLVVQALAETLQAVPPGTFDPFAITPSGITALVAGLTVTALRIAMPIMAALLLTDVGMGIVARTVPQVQILIVGAPIKIGIGLLVLGASLPVAMQLMNAVFGASLTGSTRVLLGGAS
ncbi:flagellar biosynthetic protein FliR [Tepidiforma sp.]|uniref:flagellar biosynthetic protein FliR n=1 Tax=Tepidiforma sp. TaxID=2682230 RepID=UPI002ADE6EEE|nr:flagellar biosynthetic protein FliR [Tepidiforma sp.]